MKKKNIPAAVASTNVYEALEDWARSRVQVWLQELLEDEVTQFLGRGKVGGSPNRRGYRNGHGKPRRFAMMNGTLEVRRPRVRNTVERFESQILPYFRRKSKQLGELLPELYLHGLATGDFEQAMRGLLGAGAPLSRASIQRLKSTCQLEYDEWVQQDLSGLEVVYQWADGLYVKAGIAKERAALLVIIGALSDGRKVVLACESGQRESKESWSRILRSLRRRGLKLGLSGGDHGLVQPVRAVLGSVGIDGQRLLRVGTGLGFKGRPTGDLQHGSGSTVHQRGVHPPPGRPWHHDQHGRSGASNGQHLRRTSVAYGEVRRNLSEGLPECSRSHLESEFLFSVLQSGARSSGLRLSNAGGRVLSECDERAIGHRTGRVSGRPRRRSSLIDNPRATFSVEIYAESGQERNTRTNERQSGPVETAAADGNPRKDSHSGLKTASQARLFHSSHRPGDGSNINPFQRQRSTLRPGIFCPKNGEHLPTR